MSGIFTPQSILYATKYFLPVGNAENYATTVADQVVCVVTSTYTTTVTLPNNAAAYAGRYITIVDVSGNANNKNITVAPYAGENIQGVASNYTINVARASLTFFLVPTLGGWVII